MSDFKDIKPKEKYEYCLSEIKFSGVIWSAQLSDGKWVLIKDTNGNLMFPIWPCIDSSLLVCNDIVKNSSPVSLEIDSFKEKWIKGLTDDGYKLALFPTFNSDKELDVASIHPLRFFKDLTKNSGTPLAQCDP